MNLLSEQPFYNLTERDFLVATGTWINASRTELESKDLFSDILDNPDQNSVEDCINLNIKSEYYEVKKNWELFTAIGQTKFKKTLRIYQQIRI